MFKKIGPTPQKKIPPHTKKFQNIIFSQFQFRLKTKKNDLKNYFFSTSISSTQILILGWTAGGVHALWVSEHPLWRTRYSCFLFLFIWLVEVSISSAPSKMTCFLPIAGFKELSFTCFAQLQQVNLINLRTKLVSTLVEKFWATSAPFSWGLGLHLTANIVLGAIIELWRTVLCLNAIWICHAIVVLHGALGTGLAWTAEIFTIPSQIRLDFSVLKVQTGQASRLHTGFLG